MTQPICPPAPGVTRNPKSKQITAEKTLCYRNAQMDAFILFVKMSCLIFVPRRSEMRGDEMAPLVQNGEFNCV